jgi:hypothetical protein
VVLGRRPSGYRSAGATRASELLTARGLPSLPNTTPHTLRRTHISIALLANSFDVKWVMDQVGYADSKMTMNVYAQLQQRAKHDHGAHFDELVRQARVQLRTPEETASNGPIGTESQNRGFRLPIARRPTIKNMLLSRQKLPWRDRYSNPGHHDFQATGRTTGRAAIRSGWGWNAWTWMAGD